MSLSGENAPLVYSVSVTGKKNTCHGICSAAGGVGVTRGVSEILGAWPDHLTAPCRVALGLAVCFLGGVVLVMVMYYATSVMVPGAFPVPRQLVKRSVLSVPDVNSSVRVPTDEGMSVPSVFEETMTAHLAPGINNVNRSVLNIRKSLFQSLPDDTTSNRAPSNAERLSLAATDNKGSNNSAHDAESFAQSATDVDISVRLGSHVAGSLQLLPDVERSARMAPNMKRSMGSVPGVKSSASSVSEAVYQCDAKDENDFLWRYDGLLPLDRQVHFSKDVEKVFFVKNSLDPLSPEQICALQSAQRHHGDSAYLIVIVNSANSLRQEADEIHDELTRNRLDMKPNVMFADARTFLNDTLLANVYDKLENSLAGQDQLMVLAVQLATLWRFGGTVHGLDVLTLQPGLPSNHSEDTDAALSTDGAVIRVRVPCHAVVFALMKSMLAVDINKSETVPSVILRALHSFCGTSTTAQEQGCKGLHVFDKDELCSTDNLARSMLEGKCVWAKIHSNAVTKLWANDNCPRF